jgi:hypothetical protein
MSQPRQDPSIPETTVKSKTGRTWAEWFRMLDAANCQRLGHREITGLLRNMFDVTPWWQKAIADEYILGRSRKARKAPAPAGAFAASVTRTFNVPRPVIAQAFENARLRSGWLRVEGVTERTGTPGRVVRLEWPDGTRVEARLLAKSADKCTVIVEQTRLTGGPAVTRAKAEWKAAFDRLRTRLED